jgi:hypothetical protein
MNEDTISNLIGGVPISEQIAEALKYTATKDHTYDYVLRKEVEELNRKIEMLMGLIGGVSVSEQISEAFKNIK